MTEINKLKINVIGLQYPGIHESWEIPAVTNLVQNSANNHPNLFIIGENLTKKGAELLLKTIHIQSLYTVMAYDGGACVPFSGEGQFGNGYKSILTKNPNIKLNFSIVLPHSTPFSKDMWESQNHDIKCLLIKKPLTFSRYFKNLWHPLKDLFIEEKNYYMDAQFINDCATTEGHQSCQTLVDSILQKLEATLQEEDTKSLFAFAYDESTHPFTKLFQINKVAREQRADLANHIDSKLLKTLCTLNNDKAAKSKYDKYSLNSTPTESYCKRHHIAITAKASPYSMRDALIPVISMFLMFAFKLPAAIGLASYPVLLQGLALLSLSCLATTVGKSIVKQYTSDKTSITKPSQVIQSQVNALPVSDQDLDIQSALIFSTTKDSQKANNHSGLQSNERRQPKPNYS